jgi:hypothetical protein
MGIGAQSATGVSQALLDKPWTRRQGVGMSRLVTDGAVSHRPADADLPAAVRLGQV